MFETRNAAATYLAVIIGLCAGLWPGCQHDREEDDATSLLDARDVGTNNPDVGGDVEGAGNCTDGVDNDYDGATDCEDAECAGVDGCPGSCTPQCGGGRICGPDGCGGSCGSCHPASPVCMAGGFQCRAYNERQDGSCTDGVDNDGDGATDCDDSDCEGVQGCQGTCLPACSGRQCGPDGCGNSCGSCPNGRYCSGYQCLLNPSGDEGQGTCTDGVDNDDDGVTDCNDEDCEGIQGCPPATCVPQCSGRQCGSNGCGGSCGSCSNGYYCSGFQCLSNPSGNEGPNNCHDGVDNDGDGATDCDDPACEDVQGCENTCVPQCNNRQCGSNGCGGSCGSCANGFTCSSFQCVPNPSGNEGPGNCNDGVDNDDDGAVDCNDVGCGSSGACCNNGVCGVGETCGSCSSDCGACTVGCADGVDNDGDGATDCADSSECGEGASAYELTLEVKLGVENTGEAEFRITTADGDSQFHDVNWAYVRLNCADLPTSITATNRDGPVEIKRVLGALPLQIWSPWTPSSGTPPTSAPATGTTFTRSEDFFVRAPRP